MQLTKLTIAVALSIRTHVLAAPSLPVAGQLEVRVPVMDSTADVVLRRSSPLVASELSPIVKRSPVGDIATALNILSSNITSQLNIISSTILSLPPVVIGGLTPAPLLTLDAAPTISAALNALAIAFSSTNAAIQPILGAINAFVDSEVAALVAALDLLDTLVAQLQTVLLSLITTLTASVKALVISEILALLAVISPFLSPILNFVFALIVNVNTTLSQVTSLQTASGDVFSTISNLLAPLGVLLSALLGL